MTDIKPRPSLGVTLSSILQYSRQYATMDRMKESNSGSVMPYSNMWGDPVIKYSGTGKIKLVRDLEKQSLRFKVTGDVSIVSVIPPEFIGCTGYWNPDYIKRLKAAGFGAIRLLDFMKANNSKQKVWADRPQLFDDSWVENGVPFEAIIELINSIGSQPWINIPHMADDNYVRNMATMCKGFNGVVLVEFSNEPWNDAFEQNKWFREQGAGLHKNPAKAGWLFYAKRSKQVFKIFKSVLGLKNFKLVINVQAASPDCLTTMAEAMKGVPFVLAMAPYMFFRIGNNNTHSKAVVETWSIDQLLDAFGSETLPEINKWLIKRKAEAGSIPLIIYESGQSIVQDQPHSETITNMMIDANNHPRMGDIYRIYYTLLRSVLGNDALILHYSWIGPDSPWGCWPLLNDLYQETSPKFEAFMNF